MYKQVQQAEVWKQNTLRDTIYDQQYSPFQKVLELLGHFSFCFTLKWSNDEWDDRSELQL